VNIEPLPPGFEVGAIALAIHGLFLPFPLSAGRWPIRLRVDFGCSPGFGIAPVALHFGYQKRGSG